MLHKEVMSSDVIPVSVSERKDGESGQGYWKMEEKMWTELSVIWSNPGISVR